jgi:hypothetical protein
VIAVGFVLLAFGPLVFFAPCLLRARREALRTFGNLATDYVRAFGARWLTRRADQGLLGTPDIQSLADLASAYGVLQRMRVLPFRKRQVLIVVAAVVLPMLLLVLTEIPLGRLLRDAGETWLGRVRR